MRACEAAECWLAVDQTYYEFLFDRATHVFPCAARLRYPRILHIFSFSKSFGMPGWRVGYVVHPAGLLQSFRKIQDTVPTHTNLLAQKLALRCLDVDAAHAAAHGGQTWVQATVATLQSVRDALWPVLAPLGTVRAQGAFYFLVPVPPGVDEEEAVDILARAHGVLLMPVRTQAFSHTPLQHPPPKSPLTPCHFLCAVVMIAGLAVRGPAAPAPVLRLGGPRGCPRRGGSLGSRGTCWALPPHLHLHRSFLSFHVADTLPLCVLCCVLCGAVRCIRVGGAAEGDVRRARTARGVEDGGRQHDGHAAVPAAAVTCPSKREGRGADLTS